MAFFYSTIEIKPAYPAGTCSYTCVESKRDFPFNASRACLSADKLLPRGSLLQSARPKFNHGLKTDAIIMGLKFKIKETRC